jgi:NTP pyrophosphatase (non-canonical NTP hydrolase)
MSTSKPQKDYYKQSDKSFELINRLIYKHLEERDWLDLKARGLATSIALEAAELLEHYQWEDEPVGSKQDLADELADILIYSFEFALENEIDIAVAIERKLKKAAEKYPATQFKNKSASEKRENWLDAKMKHRKSGL